MAASACSWLPAQPTFFPLVIRFLVPLAHHLPHPNSSTPILHWSCSTQRTSIWTVPWSQFRLSFPADLRLSYNTRSSCISNKRTASHCVYAISSRNSLNVVQHQLVLSVVAMEFSLLSFECLAYLGNIGTNLMRTYCGTTALLAYRRDAAFIYAYFVLRIMIDAGDSGNTCVLLASVVSMPFITPPPSPLSSQAFSFMG